MIDPRLIKATALKHDQVVRDFKKKSILEFSFKDKYVFADENYDLLILDQAYYYNLMRKII